MIGLTVVPVIDEPDTTPKSPAHRTVIHATCAIHAGTPGFCNLELIWDGTDITLWPHATGAYVLILDGSQARELHAFIGKKLLG